MSLFKEGLIFIGGWIVGQIIMGMFFNSASAGAMAFGGSFAVLCFILFNNKKFKRID
jgi:hypothetical protein